MASPVRAEGSDVVATTSAQVEAVSSRTSGLRARTSRQRSPAVGRSQSLATVGMTRTSTFISGIDAPEAVDWMQNYTLMSIFVGVNHGVEDLFYAYTTEIYPGNLGYNCNTLLYIVFSLTSLLIAAPVSIKYGSKMSIFLGLSLYCVQYFCFILCSRLQDGWYMETIAYFGAVMCGIGSGFVWASEGVFFAQSARRVADAMGEPVETKSAQLAAVFGYWSLGIETAVKVASWGLEAIGFSTMISFSGALVMAIGATVGFQLCVAPVHGKHAERQGKCEVALATVSLWSDARIWLIMFFSIAFAVAGAFINGVLAGDFVKPELGSKYIALFSAVIALVGALVQYPFRILAEQAGKIAVMGIGALALFAMPVMYYTLDMHHLGWGLLSFYVVHGIIRGINSGVNNAIYADHFPEPKTEAAFANQCTQSALSSAFFFFFAARISHDNLMKLMLAVACCIVPGLLAARRLQTASKEGSQESSSEKPGSDESSSEEGSDTA